MNSFVLGEKDAFLHYSLASCNGFFDHCVLLQFQVKFHFEILSNRRPANLQVTVKADVIKMSQVRASHILLKHSGSRNPFDRYRNK
jgi:hypothetical protein